MTGGYLYTDAANRTSFILAALFMFMMTAGVVFFSTSGSFNASEAGSNAESVERYGDAVVVRSGTRVFKFRQQ